LATCDTSLPGLKLGTVSKASFRDREKQAQEPSMIFIPSFNRWEKKYLGSKHSKGQWTSKE